MIDYYKYFEVNLYFHCQIVKLILKYEAKMSSFIIKSLLSIFLIEIIKFSSCGNGKIMLTKYIVSKIIK